MDDFSLPGYDVDELLGFGGSGEVWRAHEQATGDVVALKRLRRLGSQDALAREAALLASVRHDHVVRLRGVVPCEDGFVLVLEFAEGGSLASLLAARGRLSPGEVVTIGAPLAQALADIHARGLVHGDVTPANILFDGSGKPLLADLGVASLAGEDAGPMGATEGYADPALLSGASARPGPAGDVHGLAAVCFSALAGVPPYSESGDRFQVEPVTLGPLALGPLAPGVPPALVAAIGAGLDSDPAERPDAAAFGRMLFAACAPEAVRLARARVPTPVQPTHEVVPRPSPPTADAVPVRTAHRRRSRWPTMHRVMIGPAVTAAVALALLAGAVAGGVAWASHDHRAAASPVPASQAPVSPLAVGPATTGATDWAGVLRSLDNSRDAAFVDSDPGRLDRVYVAGSAALLADRETLGGLIAAGEQARGLRLDLVAVRVVSESAADVTLAVRDALPSYDLVRAGAVVVHLAGRGERAWTVVLHRTWGEGRWLIATITAAV